jgi:hypothetical protein
VFKSVSPDLLKDECTMTALDQMSVMRLKLSPLLGRNPLDAVLHALGGESNVAEVSKTLSWRVD